MATEAGRAGQRIGRYLVQGELGRGGMGVVLRALDTELGREVALKLVLDPASAETARLARFKREAETGARLRHPGIVPVLDFGVNEGKPFLVMELVPGESFEKLLHRGGASPRRSAEIVREVALALDHAHAHGVIHRDVKPENVIVDTSGRARLVDFGLARDESAKTQLTRTGEVLGTPAYLAPEQADGDPRSQGPHTDVYALGAVLYRALAGRPPFEASSMPELLYLVLEHAPLAPSQLAPDVPRRLEAIALRCLAKDPAKRPGSAGEVADEIGRFLEGAAAPRRAWKVVLLLGALALGATLVLRRKEPDPVARAPARIDPVKPGAGAPDPGDAAAWATRAEARRKAGDLERALADCARGLELDPRSPYLLATKASILLDLGRLDEAISHDDRALAVDDRIAALWHNRGVARGRKGDLDGALADLTHALDLDASLIKTWVERGIVRETKGDVDGAQGDFRRAIELDPSDGTAWLNLGTLRHVTGTPLAAIPAYNRAVELLPREPVAWSNRGEARVDTGDLAGGIADLDRALELAPRHADALRIRGFARAKTGDAPGAIGDLERFLEVAPDDPKAPAVRDRLAELKPR